QQVRRNRVHVDHIGLVRRGNHASSVDQGQRARAEGGIQAAQVGDGVADEVGAAVHDIHAAATGSGLVVAHQGRHVAGNVLGNQLGQCGGNVDDAQATHFLAVDGCDRVR